MTEYLVIYERGDVSWGAYSPDVPGVTAAGETRDEVEALFAEALNGYFDYLREIGEPIPQPHNFAARVAA